MNVLVIGAGMYVCGRETDGYGTVLPTLVQAQRDGQVKDLWIAATHPASLQELQRRLDALNARLGTRTLIHGVPLQGPADPQAYQHALAQIPRPACAIVVVPDHLHAAIAGDVIRAGMHVLVVKPLAPTLAEGRHLTELLEAHQVYGAVEFHKRFDEANLLLRQTIAAGRLGELRSITVEYGQRRRIQAAFASWIERTSVFQYLGVHYVDLIHFVTGARPLRVTAVGQPQEAMGGQPWRLDAIQTTVDWELTSGTQFTSSLLTNWIEPDCASAMSDQRIRVLGTGGRFDSDHKHRGVQLVTEAGGVEDVNPYFSQLYQGADGRPVAAGYGPQSIRQFLRDVRDVVDHVVQPSQLLATRPSFQSALVSTAVVEAVARSLSAGGEWTAVEDVTQMVAASTTR